jgi:hypothetical protein
MSGVMRGARAVHVKIERARMRRRTLGQRRRHRSFGPPRVHGTSQG